LVTASILAQDTGFAKVTKNPDTEKPSLRCAVTVHAVHVCKSLRLPSPLNTLEEFYDVTLCNYVGRQKPGLKAEWTTAL